MLVKKIKCKSRYLCNYNYFCFEFDELELSSGELIPGFDVYQLSFFLERKKVGNIALRYAYLKYNADCLYSIEER